MLDPITPTTPSRASSQTSVGISGSADGWSSIVRAYEADFSAHLAGTCRLRHAQGVPKMVDYDEQRGFTYEATERDDGAWEILFSPATSP